MEHTAQPTIKDTAADRTSSAASQANCPFAPKGQAKNAALCGDTPLSVHHIGYLVRNIDAALSAFLQLGYTIRQDTVPDPIRGIHICFVEKDGYLIELVSPLDSSSLVSGLLKKYKNRPYPICYETNDLDKELARLTAQSYTAIDAPTPAPALGNRRVVFLMSPFLGMIELFEA